MNATKEVRTATAEERRWWTRFKRCIQAMPPTMEVLVGAHGDLSAAERGASDATFEERGNVDNVPNIDLLGFDPKGIENNESSL